MLGNDAQQLGRASSGVASPRSAYWSYLNPATMVDLDRRLDLNLYSIFTRIDLQPRGLIGNHLDGTLDSNGIFEVFSGGIIWPLGDDKGVLGGGIFIPSAAGVKYPHSRNIISRLLQNDKDSRLDYQHMRLVLAYAYPLGNGWSVGVGIQGSMTRFRSDHLTLSLVPTAGDNEWDEALGVGFGVGIYKKWEKWAFGAVYNTRHWTNPTGKYMDLLSYHLDVPQVVQIGVAYKLTDRIELTGDLKYLDWTDVSTYGANMLQGGFNWDDQFGYKLGIEYVASNKITLMGGYAHSDTPVDSDHVMASALVPVLIEDHLTAGVTYRINDRNEIHFTAIHAFDHRMKDSGEGSADLFSLLGKGTELSSGAESFVIGYSYKF
jgi:long-chain fatty acid transport protein